MKKDKEEPNVQQLNDDIANLQAMNQKLRDELNIVHTVYQRVISVVINALMP